MRANACHHAGPCEVTTDIMHAMQWLYGVFADEIYDSSESSITQLACNRSMFVKRC